MKRRNPAAARLLGGLSTADFLGRHWQRRPLLVRGALDAATLRSLPARDDLFELAARSDVESRTVVRSAGRWTVRHGPFPSMPRRTRDWTLLVQGVNLIDEHADALMRRFDFVSTMRLDDVMTSYAVDGGGVGPHLDSYDVFLVQVAGRRRWRWRARASTSPRDRETVAGAPIKQLAHFEPTDEAILEAGDLLYLPPSCAHEGTAVGECITASVGFRAPAWNELIPEFLLAMAERPHPDGRHGDAGRVGTARPAALDIAMLDALSDRVSRLRFAASDVEDFAGRQFSTPKPHVFFDRPPKRRRLSAMTGIALDLRATMLYRGMRAWIAGEAFALPRGSAPTFRRLADRRRLSAASVARLLDDDDARTLLDEWWQHGWIVIDDRTTDGTP